MRSPPCMAWCCSRPKSPLPSSATPRPLTRCTRKHRASLTHVSPAATTPRPHRKNQRPATPSLRLYPARTQQRGAGTGGLIDRQAVERLPRERRSVLLLDLATAHHQVGQYERAVSALLRADQIAAEEVRCRPASQALITSSVNYPGRAPSAQLKALARQQGVTT